MAMQTCCFDCRDIVAKENEMTHNTRLDQEPFGVFALNQLCLFYTCAHLHRNSIRGLSFRGLIAEFIRQTIFFAAVNFS